MYIHVHVYRNTIFLIIWISSDSAKTNLNNQICSDDVPVVIRSLRSDGLKKIILVSSVEIKHGHVITTKQVKYRSWEGPHQNIKSIYQI